MEIDADGLVWYVFTGWVLGVAVIEFVFVL